MKIRCNTKELADNIQIAVAAVAGKPANAVLGGLCPTAKGNLLKVSGMDSNLSISMVMKAEVLEEGSLLIPAKMLSALTRKLTGTETSVYKSEDGNVVVIENGRSKSRLPLLDLENYPPTPKADTDTKLTVSASKLKELIQKSIYAVSSDNARPLFTGVQVSLTNDILQFTGTNTHRIALKTIKLATEYGNVVTIIPAPILREMSKIVTEDVEQNIKIGLGKKSILFGNNNIQMLSNVIEGKFPDIKRIIPDSFKTIVKLSRKDLLESLERLRLFTSSSENNIIKFDFQSLMVDISSEQKETGYLAETLSCNLEGEPLKLAFNSQYIIDVLKSMNAENVILKLNSSLSPACLIAENENDYINIITPIRIVF